MNRLDIKIKIFRICERPALGQIVVNEQIVEKADLVVVLHFKDGDFFNHVERDQGGGSLDDSKIDAGDFPVILPHEDVSIQLFIAVNWNGNLRAFLSVDHTPFAAAQCV